jgi:hypothetical protein
MDELLFVACLIVFLRHLIGTGVAENIKKASFSQSKLEKRRKQIRR